MDGMVVTKLTKTYLLPIAYHTRKASSLAKAKSGMPGFNEAIFLCQTAISNRFFSILVCDCRNTGLTLHIETMDVRDGCKAMNVIQTP